MNARVWPYCVLAATLVLLSCKAGAQAIQAVSEVSVPLQHVDSQGAVVGPAAELVREVMRRAGMPCEIRLFPWPRAYAMAETEPNVLIFSIARNADRKHKFKWVGEVYPAEFRFIKLKSRTDIQLKNLDDARKYSVGVVNQDITHQFLTRRKFAIDRLDITASNELNFKKLVAGRVDLVLRSARALNMLCQRDKAMCDQLETSFVVDEMRTSLWMAFSNTTPDDVVARARTAYDAVRADGSWNSIMRSMPR
jgi:polar amino acid transport system substrate-binding protein